MMFNQNTSILQIICNLVWIVVKAVALFVIWDRFVPIQRERGNSLKSKYSTLFCVLILIELIRWHFDFHSLLSEMVLWLVLPLIFTLLFRRYAIKETVFSLLLYLNFRHLSYFVVGSAVNFMSRQLMKGVDTVADINKFVYERIGFLYNITYFFYIVMIMIEILPVLRIERKEEKITWYDCGYLSVMNVAGIILSRIMMGIALLAGSNGSFILTDEKPELLWELPMVAVLLYIGELSAIIIWQKYRKYRQWSEIYFVENMEKDAIRQRLEDTERYYEQIRKVRHEMASHMTNIKGLAEQGNIEELGQYISKIDETIKSVEVRYKTGNPVTDVVLNDRARKAEERGIVCSFTFSFVEEWGIPVYDLSIILSNILDNAIKAADEAEGVLRYVHLRVSDRGAVILIQCENGCGTQKQESEKKADIWHGIGLKNVEEIADRHYGAVNVKKDENVYSISVMLKKNDLL